MVVIEETVVVEALEATEAVVALGETEAVVAASGETEAVVAALEETAAVEEPALNLRELNRKYSSEL